MSNSFWRKAANQLLKYALIIWFSFVALFLAYSLHTSLIIVGVNLNLESNLLWILDVLGTVILGSVMLFCIAAIDNSLQKGPLWRKTLRLFKIETVTAVLVLGLEFVLKTLLKAS